MIHKSASFIPYGRHCIDEEDIAKVIEVLRGGWLTTGPEIEAFEKALAERVGAQHAIACSSGTAALHLATLALSLGPGDAAIVPALTFLATANAVRLVGAEVVFADVDPTTGLLTADALDAALREAEILGRGRIKAVLPVHLNGQSANMVEIAAVASRAHLRVIEDGCHALGTCYDVPPAVQRTGDCRYSDLTVFSFHPVKTITMGEGGAVTTNRRDLAGRIRVLRNHGMLRYPESLRHGEGATDTSGLSNPWYYEMHEMGLNYRASDLQCGLGLSQLGKLPRFVATRRSLTEYYDRRMATLAPVVRPISRVERCKPAWHLYVVQIDFEAIGKSRAGVMAELAADGIGTQVHYIPVCNQPYYQKRYGAVHLPGAESYYRRALSLPLFPGMSEQDIDHVVRSLARTIDVT